MNAWNRLATPPSSDWTYSKKPTPCKEMADTTPDAPDHAAFGGSCACGRMTYQCFTAPMAVAVCHCITCRKLGGGSYQCFAVIEANKLVIHDSKNGSSLPGLPAKSECGIEFLQLSPFAERALCADCHTPFGMRYKHSPKTHSIALGSVDEDSIRDDKVRKALQPGFHIFTSQRAWWCKGIGEDGLRRCERFTGDFEQDIKDWEKANLK